MRVLSHPGFKFRVMSAFVLSAVMSVTLMSELLEMQRDREGVQIQCWCQSSSSVSTQLVTRV